MFNLPPKIVVFDLEYTTWEGAEARNWSGHNEYREIVQIGAVEVETNEFRELDSFSMYIKPKKNPILSEFFTRLTSITQEMIERGGVDFPEALQKFHSWCQSHAIVLSHKNCYQDQKK